MRLELLEYLACPSCGADLVIVESYAGEREIMTGTLACESCKKTYPIRAGVPRLTEAMEGLARVAKSFTFEWKAHHEGRLERDTLFGLTPAEDWAYFEEATALDTAKIRGSVVLDAGCGSARLTRQIGERGAKAVIGMDIIDAVDEAFAWCRDVPNVHIVQGNIFAPPLKQKRFDLVWSNGVIHHTPDAEAAHRSLAAHVKSGGTLYVWVYARRFNPFRFTKDVLDLLRVTRMQPRFLLFLANVFSYASVALLRLYQLVRRIPGLQPRTAWGHRTVRNRTLDELRLTWFDAISPQYDSRHSEEEVIGWFNRLGFRDVYAIEEPKVGVRGIAP